MATLKTLQKDTETKLIEANNDTLIVSRIFISLYFQPAMRASHKASQSRTMTVSGPKTNEEGQEDTQ